MDEDFNSVSDNVIGEPVNNINSGEIVCYTAYIKVILHRLQASTR